VDPRACLDDVEKIKFLTLPSLELRPLGRPARSQSLHILVEIKLLKFRFIELKLQVAIRKIKNIKNIKTCYATGQSQ
jgi:hypothetical protein